MKRPAEVGALAFAAAALVARLAGIEDVDVVTALAIVGGAAPAAITMVVSVGGVRGAVRRLWSGKSA